jgi:CheY-like chemotaxis protein
MSKPAILCVDDEAIVLESLEIQLQKTFGNKYLYEFAESAEEALEILEELVEDQIQVVVIISDWLMPGMKGDEFLVRVHQKIPNVIKIMLTGQADEEAIERAKDEANLYQLFYKPWNTNQLVQSIEVSLEL